MSLPNKAWRNALASSGDAPSKIARSPLARSSKVESTGVPSKRSAAAMMWVCAASVAVCATNSATAAGELVGATSPASTGRTASEGAMDAAAGTGLTDLDETGAVGAFFGLVAIEISLSLLL